MGKRVSVGADLEDIIEELLDEGKVITDDGQVARQIGRKLAPLRKDGNLSIGYDQKNGNSVIALKGKPEYKKSKKGFGGALFDILFR